MTAPAGNRAAPWGAVLCGGDSRRMGRDKALVPVDGVPMAERVACALAAGGCTDVVLVGGDRAALTAATGRPWVADRFPGDGPLGGLLTALAAASGRDVVVAACDLPDLDDASVRTLIEAGAASDTAETVVAVTEHPHLVGWWRGSTAPRVEQLFAQGERGIRRALRHLAVVEIAVSPAAVWNVNTPDELHRGR